MKTAAISLIVVLAMTCFGCASREANDAGISAKIKTKMAADSETSAIKIGVDTVHGVVTLTGTVPTEREKAKAEQLARTTEGVTQVVNNIVVNPNSVGATNIEEKAREAANQVGDKAREAANKVEEKAREAAGTVGADAAILAKIKTKFLTEGITGTNVDVAGGAVTIKGEVETERKRTLAADLARATEGVVSVNNQLTIKAK